MITSLRCTAILLLLTLSLAWLDLAVAKGPPIRVEQAIPSEAAQGQQGLPVKIKGKGFGPGSTVRFLVAGTNDDSQIVVPEVVYDPATGDLDTVIDVSETAAISDYDIEVRLGGRGGKGTDLFRVKSGEVRIVTLDITYEFGALSNDVCVAPDCVVTTITATAPLVCGTNSCEFKSTSVVDETFSLPAGLRDLLFATSWRGTPLDPDGCFGSSDADEVGTALIDGNIVFLRRYNDDATPWEASVGTWARDILDIEDRTHIFNFVGCGAESCGAFAPGSMEGIYEGGKLTRIDGPGNDRKFLSIPCRCTVSNTPDCPVDVPVPTPELRITVVDVTP